MGKKSGPKAPPPPDPYKTADAQGEVNKETAIAQANLNRINQVTPQGTITYNQIGTNADGTPKYEQVMSYSPENQQLFDQQNQIALALGGLAGDNISRVADAQSTPLNFDGMTPLQNLSQTNIADAGPLTTGVNRGNIQQSLDYSGLDPINTDFDATTQAASDAVYNQLASRLDPQFQQLEGQMRDRLINSGIAENSDAFRREMDNFARQRTDAYNTAANQGILTGLQAQQQGFGQSLASRQQGVDEINTQGAFANQAQDMDFNQQMQQAGLNNAAQAQRFSQNAAQFGAGMSSTGFNNDIRQREIEEAAYLRNIPLNDIAALLGTGGGVQAPSFGPVSQVGLSAPDLMGAVYNSNQIAQNQWQQQQQARSQGLGSIFGLAGSALGAFSDRRLKENVERVGTLPDGIATYVFNYIGDKARQFGVMAQELIGTKPEAVTSVGGYLYVDYRKVYG